jgi:hypothetical protein
MRWALLVCAALLLVYAVDGLKPFGRMQRKRLNDAADAPHVHKLRGLEKGGGDKDPSDPSAHCTEKENDLHIVFSTGCNAFQHWQAETLLNAAWHAGQVLLLGGIPL